MDVRALAIASGSFFFGFAMLAACSDTPTQRPIQQTTTPADPVPKTYPTLDAIYRGDIGIYRGCGPNNSVCHNGKEFPNLATLGSIVQNIDVPCNQKKTKPLEMHDLCERSGDLLRVGGKDGEIAYFVNEDPAAEASLKWTIVLREAVAGDALSDRLGIVRPKTGPMGTDVELLSLTDFGVALALDTDPKKVHVTIPTVDDGTVRAVFSKAGAPGDPASVQLGDPNQNGVFGASLGGRLVKPGDPNLSYLFKRILDPAAGPLMPRANCCYWTRDAVRALWCWVAGLEPDGSNALAPIDYGACTSSPPDTVLYPTPGPKCEETQKGMCPVQPKEALGDDPTWANLYPRLFKQTCASCHSGAAAPGGFDLGSEEAAYPNVMRRVAPGNAQQSKLYRVISPGLCGTDCTLMPYRQSPLDDRTRGLVQQWINDGARR